MRAPAKPDFKLFWMMIVLGLICAGIGGAFAWLDHAAEKWGGERAGWVSGRALLYEVGIRWSNARRGSNYEMTARYVLHVDGRDYEGSEIAGGYYSKSAVEVRSLFVPFAPEAAEYSLQDLGVLNPQRTWLVGYRPVPVRYDPRDPAHSQMVLDKPIAIEAAGNWVSRGITLFFLLAGAVLLVFAWPAARGRGWGKAEYRPPAGPELWEYPEAEHRRMLQLIEQVRAEILRIGTVGATGEMRFYAERIEEMAAAAREGSLVPLHYAGLRMGRGADEVYGDSLLVNAAFALQECVDELARRPPGSGHAVST